MIPVGRARERLVDVAAVFLSLGMLLLVAWAVRCDTFPLSFGVLAARGLGVGAFRLRGLFFCETAFLFGRRFLRGGADASVQALAMLCSCAKGLSVCV